MAIINRDFLLSSEITIIETVRILPKYRIFLIIILSLFSISLTIAELTDAALKPEEIVVVVNSNSQDSVRLGRLYIKLRKIATAHLIEVRVPTGEYISRKKYINLLAAPIRKNIKKLHDKGVQIRCIVTIYGVPLHAGEMPPGASKEEIKKYKEIAKQKEEELSRLKELLKKNRSLVKNIKKLQSEIGNIHSRLEHLLGYDTVAAVDSELALLFYPSYSLVGWQPNPEFLFNRGRIKEELRQVFMVSRLDAPTPKLVEGMIRTAIEVEKTGLSGKFYLDARGITSKSAYGKFDEDIRRTAEILQKSSMPVVLDNRRKLFGPGDAPDAALYCGWYSLARYKDAFEWSKGAVGYHVASAEARSLHDPKRNYWVKSMIERGVIATLGPVGEPYLHAFPLPSLFFQLLMSGQYSLAEVFSMTNPFLSWRMILVGDPLYNPFKQNPAYPLKSPPPPPK